MAILDGKDCCFCMNEPYLEYRQYGDIPLAKVELGCELTCSLGCDPSWLYPRLSVIQEAVSGKEMLWARPIGNYLF